jgi:hypothetical protein
MTQSFSSPFNGFRKLGRRRAGAGATVANQSVTFGALTTAGAVGAKPVNSLGAEVDLTGTPTLVGGSAGVYTASITSGRLAFTGAAGAPNGSIWRCTLAAGGTVDLTVDQVASARTVGSDAELTTWLGLSAANKQGTTCIVRFGDYRGVAQSVWNARLEGLASACVIRGERGTLRPIMGRMGAYNTTTTGLVQGRVTFEDLDIRATVALGDKRTTDAIGLAEMIATRNDNPIEDIIIRRCSFSGNAPIARLTAQRPAQVLIGVNMQRGTGLTVEDCDFSYITSGVFTSADNSTIRRNTFSYLFDDAIRAIPTGANTVLNTLSVTDNLMHNFIGDHGTHPDMFHMFANGGSQIDGVTYRGNVFYPGTESALAPAWPTAINSAGYTPDASLTAANISLDATFAQRFVYMDAVTPRTVTLINPTIPASNFDVCIQTWFDGTVTIDPAGFNVIDADNGNAAVVSPITFTAPWATIQIRLDATLNRWSLHRQGPVYQGVFSNAITDGIDNAAVDHNLFWIKENAVRQDGVNSSSWAVHQNTFLPAWPGDLNGNGTANETAEYGPEAADRFILFAGSGNLARGNISGSISGGSGLDADTASRNVTTNFNADLAALQTALGTGSSTIFPQSLTEAINLARPAASWWVTNCGVGCGLAPDAADDYYNFGQHGGAKGFRVTTPWFVQRPSVTVAPGGFNAAWFVPYGTVTSYNCEYRINGGSWTATTVTGTTATFAGAAVSDVVDVRIRAVNANGNGPWSPVQSVTVTVAGGGPITPAALRATYRDGVGTSSKTITTTTSATGNHPVLVAVMTRYGGAGNVLQDITATLNAVPMTRLTQHMAGGNFQIAWFWATSADVPSGTWDVVITNGTNVFNGVAVSILEMTNATDSQTGAVYGAANFNAASTTRTPTVTTANSGSLVFHGSVSQFALTGLTGTDVTLVDGTTNSGNTVTWAALAYEAAATPGAYDATFTQGTANGILAGSIEVRK